MHMPYCFSATCFLVLLIEESVRKACHQQMAPLVEEDGSPFCQGLVGQCALLLVLSKVLWPGSDNHILAAWLSNLHTMSNCFSVLCCSIQQVPAWTFIHACLPAQAPCLTVVHQTMIKAGQALDQCSPGCTSHKEAYPHKHLRNKHKPTSHFLLHALGVGGPQTSLHTAKAGLMCQCADQPFRRECKDSQGICSPLVASSLTHLWRQRAK